MALKDLVVSHAELTEEQIEGIVAAHVRYNPTAPAIVLLPATTALTNRQRLLIYLVALRGWPFVKPDDSPPTGATPSELETALRIPGGTLRPLLKRLREARLVEESDGRYSVNPATFPFVQDQISAEDEDPEDQPAPAARDARRKVQRPRRQASPAPQEEVKTAGMAPEPPDQNPGQQEIPAETRRRSKRDATVAGAGPLQRLRALIAAGWFAQPKSTRDIVAEFAKRGANYKRTDLTRQLITLVRRGELSRDMAQDGKLGRKIWKYVSA